MSIVLDGTTGVTSSGSVKADAITNVAGTGAPDFPNGFTVAGAVPESGGNAYQILLNRPSPSNFSLSNGVYNANFNGGSVTGSVTKSTASINGTTANLIPVMSGGTTSACSSGSVSCSVTPTGASNLSTLFDNNVATYFPQYTSNTMTVTVDLGATEPIYGYFIDRFAGSLVYQPRTWTFQGSADNSTWMTLDSYSSPENWGAEVLTRFAISNYRYYRWVFSANNGQPSAGGYVIEEINILTPSYTTGSFTSETYTAATAPTSATVKARIATGTAPVSGSTYTLSASRDNGTTWTALPFTVSPSNPISDGAFYISGTASIASQPSGTQMKYKIEAASANFSAITAVTLEWS
jgi:hypothetical protein